MNTPKQAPKQSAGETLAHLHQTRIGDWAEVLEAARRESRDKEAMRILHDLSPKEHAEQMFFAQEAQKSRYRAVGVSARLLTWLGNCAFRWESWVVLGVMAAALMGMFGVDAAGLGDGK